MSEPYRITRTTYRGRSSETLTFTGSTEEEYDLFRGARFADGREAIGWDTSASAPYVQIDGKMVPCRFRRFVTEVSGG